MSTTVSDRAGPRHWDQGLAPIAPVITEAFLEYAQSRGFQIDTTRVRRPKDKARVERTVPTVRDDCFGGERLRTLDDTRARALHWCLEEYGMKRHARTQRLPREHQSSDVTISRPGRPIEVRGVTGRKDNLRIVSGSVRSVTGVPA